MLFCLWFNAYIYLFIHVVFNTPFSLFAGFSCKRFSILLVFDVWFNFSVWKGNLLLQVTILSSFLYLTFHSTHAYRFVIYLYKVINKDLLTLLPRDFQWRVEKTTFSTERWLSFWTFIKLVFQDSSSLQVLNALFIYPRRHFHFIKKVNWMRVCNIFS